MALDTANKRFSIQSQTLPWRGTMPVPDGTIAQADRPVFLYHYTDEWSINLAVADWIGIRSEAIRVGYAAGSAGIGYATGTIQVSR